MFMVRVTAEQAALGLAPPPRGPPPTRPPRQPPPCCCCCCLLPSGCGCWGWRRHQTCSRRCERRGWWRCPAVPRTRAWTTPPSSAWSSVRACVRVRAACAAALCAACTWGAPDGSPRGRTGTPTTHSPLPPSTQVPLHPRLLCPPPRARAARGRGAPGGRAARVAAAAAAAGGGGRRRARGGGLRGAAAPRERLVYCNAGHPPTTPPSFSVGQALPPVLLLSAPAADVHHRLCLLGGVCRHQRLLLFLADAVQRGGCRVHGLDEEACA